MGLVLRVCAINAKRAGLVSEKAGIDTGRRGHLEGGNGSWLKEPLPLF